MQISKQNLVGLFGSAKDFPHENHQIRYNWKDWSSSWGILGENPGDCDGGTTLHWAAINGHLYVYKYISRYLVNKNPRNDYGTTSFHTTAEFGFLELVEEIFKMGLRKIQNVFAMTGDFEVCILVSVRLWKFKDGGS